MLQKTASFIPSEPRKISMRDFRDLIHKLISSTQKRKKRVGEVCNTRCQQSQEAEQADCDGVYSYHDVNADLLFLKGLGMTGLSSDLVKMSVNLDKKRKIHEKGVDGFESVKAKMVRKRTQLISLK
jgi:hypothetical protein